MTQNWFIFSVPGPTTIPDLNREDKAALEIYGTAQSDEYADVTTQFGMGLNFHSDTTANLTDGTTFQSRVAKSFVFDETVDTLAWYPGG